MKNRNNKFGYRKSLSLILITLSLSLSGCGGGDGDSSGGTVSSSSSVAQLGYISSGTITLMNLNGDVISTTTTTSTSDSVGPGHFSFSDVELEADTYYVLSVTGGEDVDADDDGIIDDTATTVSGTFYGLAKGSDILAGAVRVNALTDIIYHLVENDLLDSNLEFLLNQEATILLSEKVDGEDGNVTYDDIINFNPVEHSTKTKISYESLISSYINRIHEGDATSPLSVLSDLALFSIDCSVNSTVTPYIISCSIPNLKMGESITWSLDSTALSDPDSIEISDNEAHTLSASVTLVDGTIKTLETKLEVAKTTETVVSTVSVQDSSSIEVVNDEDEYYENAVVDIQSGALDESLDVSAVLSYPNSTASFTGASSPILALEPSGTVFNKPVTITMPFDFIGGDPEDSETDSGIYITAANEGDPIEIIEPDTIDYDNGLVTFTTTHFTDYQVEQVVDEDAMSKAVAEIMSLNSYLGERHPLEISRALRVVYQYDVTGGKTIYDLYLIWKRNQKLYSLMNKYKFTGPFEYLFKTSTSRALVEDIKAAYKIGSTLSLPGSFRSIIGSDNLKKAYVALLGAYVPTSVSDAVQLASIQTITAFVKAYNNIAMNQQLQTYFSLRNDNISRDDILNCSLNSICTQDLEGKNIDGSDEGWLDRSHKVAYVYPTAELWNSAEILYGIYASVRDQDPTQALVDIVKAAVTQNEMSTLASIKSISDTDDPLIKNISYYYNLYNFNRNDFATNMMDIVMEYGEDDSSQVHSVYVPHSRKCTVSKEDTDDDTYYYSYDCTAKIEIEVSDYAYKYETSDKENISFKIGVILGFYDNKYGLDDVTDGLKLASYNSKIVTVPTEALLENYTKDSDYIAANNYITGKVKFTKYYSDSDGGQYLDVYDVPSDAYIRFHPIDEDSGNWMGIVCKVYSTATKGVGSFGAKNCYTELNKTELSKYFSYNAAKEAADPSLFQVVIFKNSIVSPITMQFWNEDEEVYGYIGDDIEALTFARQGISYLVTPLNARE